MLQPTGHLGNKRGVKAKKAYQRKEVGDGLPTSSPEDVML